MEIIYQSEDQTIKISCDPASVILMIQFDGIILHQTYQEAYNEFIKWANTHQCTKFIYDTKKIKKVSIKSRTWYLNHVAPKILSPTVRIAIIKAENIGNQIATDTMRDGLIEMGYSKLAVKRFDTFEEALVWLDPSKMFLK